MTLTIDTKHLARIVEMNRDPAVAFDARNGIDDDFAGHGSFSRI